MMIRRLVSLTFALILCTLSGGALASTIEAVAPAALEARIASSKGYWVVNITSTDPKCGYCAPANAKFVKLSNSTDNMAFAQVSWQPWTQFPEELHGFFQRNQINGIPVRLVYLDGKLVDKTAGVPQDSPPASPLQVSGNIPIVDSRQIAEKIRQTKGLVVVQLTSFETACSFCIRSNPVFEAIAKDAVHANVQFLRVTYRPWVQMTSDPFALTFEYTGLPIYAVYKDGKFVRKHGGHAEKPELQKLLFNSLE